MFDYSYLIPELCFKVWLITSLIYYVFKAIDHLEQQERRNSQDQQSGEESEASSAKN